MQIRPDNRHVCVSVCVCVCILHVPEVERGEVSRDERDSAAADVAAA